MIDTWEGCTLYLHVQSMRNMSIVSLTAEMPGERVLVFSIDTGRVSATGENAISESNPLPPYGKTGLCHHLYNKSAMQAPTFSHFRT